MREAQAGDEQAFTRLWRDANPLIVRYLRVVGADDPYDAACEGWLTAVRGLVGFTGDEAAWRVWVLACARQRAEQGAERQGWATVTPIDRRAFSTASAASAASTAASAATAATAATMAGRGRDGLDDELDIDALLATTPDADPEHRGLGDTITALRALPLGQGEILVLRLGGELPVRSVSDIVGSDSETVRRAETRALERLGADAELIGWSLDAPATAAELADERVALGAFRSIPRPPAWTVPRTRVVTVGNAPPRRKDGRPSHGIANAAGRSRTALLGIATISASVMSLGGLSAAAYVGALPDGVQQIMHDRIGAPAPVSTRSTPSRVAPGSPTASNPAGNGGKPGGSAGNPAVQPTAQAPKPSSSGGKPTKTPNRTTPTKVVPAPQGTGSPTRTPEPSSTATKAPHISSTPKSTRTKAPAGDTTRTKSPYGSSTRTKAPVGEDATSSTSTTAPDPSSTTDVAPVG